METPEARKTGAEKVLEWMNKYYAQKGTPNFGEIQAQLEMAIDEEFIDHHNALKSLSPKEEEEKEKIKPFTYEWWEKMRIQALYRAENYAWQSHYFDIAYYCEERELRIFFPSNR